MRPAALLRVIAPALVLGALTAVSFPVTTADAAAQAHVNRGLLYYYAYDGGDAAIEFAAAATREPALAMAYWGQALADGPDLNTPMTQERFARAQAAAEKAVALERDAGRSERAFIDAMALRYRGTWADWSGDDDAYRSATIALATDTSDAAAARTATLLAAEALLETGGLTWTGSSPATANARRSLELIDGVLARDPADVMANHLCLHAYDLAGDRAPARVCAQHLDAAVLPPQAEHLAHMPAHYWIESGNYAAAAASSDRAYRLFVQLRNVPGRDPDHDRYFNHDVYVGYSAAMMLEDADLARLWSQRMNAAYGISYDALTALRFGRYADAFALARGDTPNELAVRGLAALELGNLPTAREAAAQLQKTTTYGDLVQIFLGAFAQRERRYADATHWIDRAVATQRDTFAAELLPLLPALEVRGALAMQRAAYPDAVTAYRAALTAYPNDPRALAGLAAAQRALGTGLRRPAGAQGLRERGERIAHRLSAVGDTRAHAGTSSVLR